MKITPSTHAAVIPAATSHALGGESITSSEPTGRPETGGLEGPGLLKGESRC